MSGSSPLLLAAFAFLMVIAALLLLRPRPDAELRGRAESLGLGRNLAQHGEADGPSIRATLRDERSVLARGLGMLGYNPEIPAKYAMSWQATAAIGATIGLVAVWRLQGPFALPLALVLGIVIGLGAMRFLFRRAASRYSNLLFTQIPDAISLVLRAVRSGLPVSEAIRTIGQETASPTADEFARVSREMSVGVPVEAAIWSLYQRSQVREYAFLSVTLGLQAQSGGNLVETLANLADLVRRRVSMAAKVQAISAEGRASATILVAMPFVVGVLMALLAPDYVGELFTHERSPGFLLAFVVLMTSGIFTVRWMIQRSTSD